jgi:hypothetical protein
MLSRWQTTRVAFSLRVSFEPGWPLAGRTGETLFGAEAFGAADALGGAAVAAEAGALREESGAGAIVKVPGAGSEGVGRVDDAGVLMADGGWDAMADALARPVQ